MLGLFLPWEKLPWYIFGPLVAVGGVLSLLGDAWWQRWLLGPIAIVVGIWVTVTWAMTRRHVARE